MGAVSVKNIIVTPLRAIETEGGNVLHGMKHTDEGCCGFGEAYFSYITLGAIKAWKRHMRMTMNLIVPAGRVKFVFCSIIGTGFQEFRIEEIGADRYARITVPPGIWFGFKGLESPQSLVLNIGSIAHDPAEVERLKINEIEYLWG